MKISTAHLILALMAPAALLAQPVVINEIAWMGTRASASDEWIELCNTTPAAVDLQGWHLVAADGAPAIALRGVIPAGGFFVLERTDDQTIADRPADQLFTGDLKNSGEWLMLRDTDSVLVDQVRCDSSGWFAGSNTTKTSMEKKHPGIDAMQPESWAANDTLTRNGQDARGWPINGTPGAVNSAYDHALPAGRNDRRSPARLAAASSSLAAWPNPFNPDTMLEWHSPDAGVIEILDLRGCSVRSWITRRGHTRVFWDGCDCNGRPVASGIYICRLRRGNGIAASLRLVRLR